MPQTLNPSNSRPETLHSNTPTCMFMRLLRYLKLELLPDMNEVVILKPQIPQSMMYFGSLRDLLVSTLSYLNLQNPNLHRPVAQKKLLPQRNLVVSLNPKP